jgi:hypothetical protein
MYSKLAALPTASLNWRVGLITLVSRQILSAARALHTVRSCNNTQHLFIYLFIILSIYFLNYAASCSEYSIEGKYC